MHGLVTSLLSTASSLKRRYLPIFPMLHYAVIAVASEGVSRPTSSCLGKSWGVSSLGESCFSLSLLCLHVLSFTLKPLNVLNCRDPRTHFLAGLPDLSRAKLALTLCTVNPAVDNSFMPEFTFELSSWGPGSSVLSFFSFFLSSAIFLTRFALGVAKTGSVLRNSGETFNFTSCLFGGILVCWIPNVEPSSW